MMIFNQETKSKLRMIYYISVSVFLVSMFPRYNTYIFHLSRNILLKLGVIENHNDYELYDEQVGLIRKCVMKFYNLIARLYGMEYLLDKRRGRYIYYSKNGSVYIDICQLFYFSHQDLFSVDWILNCKDIGERIRYNKMMMIS